MLAHGGGGFGGGGEGGGGGGGGGLGGGPGDWMQAPQVRRQLAKMGGWLQRLFWLYHEHH